MCETHRHSAAGRSGTATVERAMPKTPAARREVLTVAETDAFLDAHLPPPPQGKPTSVLPLVEKMPQDHTVTRKPDEKPIRPADTQPVPVHSSVEVSRPAHVNPRVTTDEDRKSKVAEILGAALEKEAHYQAQDSRRQLRHLQREVVGQLYSVLLNRAPSLSEFATGQETLTRNVQNAIGRLYANDAEHIPPAPKFLKLRTNN